MAKLFLEVFNEGLSQTEMNAVRGGVADPFCTCNAGATYDCGCYSDCTCNGDGSALVCSRNIPKPICKTKEPPKEGEE